MTDTFFTSDTHFGHEMLCVQKYRPFANASEMDREIIRRWNNTVQPGDTVYHLGDFTMKGHVEAETYRSALNGKIHLIHGNHDRSSVKKLTIWATSEPIKTISLDGTKIVLCHYAMRVWDKCHHGAIHLYGHSHGGLEGNSASLDVGVDAWDYTPVTLDQIQRRMKTLTTFRSGDHHHTP